MSTEQRNRSDDRQNSQTRSTAPVSARSSRTASSAGVRRISTSESRARREMYNRSPASRGYPKECTDFGEFSMQSDNRAVRIRTAHLQWLQDNNVYSNNSIDEWQPSLREHRPSNSARYPIRMTTPKESTDPEWVAEDYRIHIYHSKKDGLWVKEWLRGILQARRFQITTNMQPCPDCHRVIIIMSPNFLASGLVARAADAIHGRISLVIKIDGCEAPAEIEDCCHTYMDLSRLDMTDYTFQFTLMFRLLKDLDLPVSVCSA